MLNMHTLRQFWRFGIAAGIGFVVDVLVLCNRGRDDETT